MGITNLPKPGLGFKATLGPGSFKKKLSSATRYGDLKNLRDNQEAIFKEIKKRQGIIRTKGGLSRLQQRDSWLRIKASDKTITKEDQREIKEVLKALGRGKSAGAEKLSANKKLVKASDKKSYLTEAQIKKNLNRAKYERIDEPFMTRSTAYSRQYAGGKTIESRVRGTMKDLGVDVEKRAGKIGFAADYNKNSKLPDNSLPKIPPAGVRPLGL